MGLSLFKKISKVFLCKTILNFLKIYKYLLTLRLTIVWFPSINPYLQPFYFLTELTDPFLNIFKSLVNLHYNNFDFSALIGIFAIHCSIIVFQEFITFLQ